MKELQKDELLKMNGGGFGLGLLIGGITTFIIGVIDGYVRPLKCR